MDNKTKLIPCICGQIEKEIIENHCLDDMGRHKAYYYFVQCSKCRMSTCMEFYTKPEQAAEAWRVMQTALQAGWSSEVPTDQGFYLHKYSTGRISTIEVDVDGTMYHGEWEYPKTMKWKGLWYRINYPPN